MALEQQIPDTIVRTAQRGDAAALSRLLELARPRIYRWAIVQTGSPDEAEDLTQETLMRAAKGLRDFAFNAQFTTWLHAIVRSTAADWRRTARRRQSLLLERHDATMVTRQPEPSATLVTVVKESLGALSGRQREVFDLVDLQGRSPAEAAVQLGLNAATVRVHLLRARRRLRLQILEKHPHLVEDLR